MNTKEILQGIKNWTTSKLGGKVDNTTTVNGHALSGNVTVSKSDVGLGNVTNDAQVTRAEMGAASGVATLDTAGKVPSSQLPSYVDDVLEFNSKDDFPSSGETGKIYVDKTTNKTWRWGGTDYVEISQSLALGETSSTAYAGDKGKALADKLATIENGAEVNVQSDWDATEGDAFIKNKPTIPVVPTNVSAFTNDVGYLTQHQSLDNYYDKDETEELLDDKQDALVSGTNIKTINSQSILGSGDIVIEGGGNDTDVNYDTTNKKITKTIDDVTSDVVTAATIVQDGGGIEVEIGETAPTGTPKLFVDEDADPSSSINIYNKTQVDTLLDGKVSNPIELTSLSADYTFKEGDTIIVGTGLYKCTAETTTLPPFNFVFDANGSVVIDTINGYEAVVVDSDTLNTGWEKVMEVSDRYYTEMRVAQMDSKKADKATTAAGYGIIDVYTKNQIDALTRHTRLTDFDLDVLKKAVADQNLEKYGLKVGDEKTINGHTYVIADLNTMKGTLTPYRITTNHVGLIVIPHTTQAWNASGNTSTGADGRGAGYLNCDLHYYLKNTLLPLVETDLGAANLLGHSKLLSNAVTDSKSSGWTWELNCKICALSEVQVYGATIWSSSGYDTGEACRQLDVFRHYNFTEILGSEGIWLRDVVPPSGAAVAFFQGNANYYIASAACYAAALILFH